MEHRHPTLLRAHDASLLIIDIQPRLSRLVPRRNEVIATTLRLIRLAEIFNLPVGLTEQNSAKFGHTERPIIEALAAVEQNHVRLVHPPVNKLEFSACASDAARELTLKQLAGPQIILVGMETHICILQTALDLLHAGKQVHVVADGVASRGSAQHKNGLRRMQQAGCILTNWESVCYEVAYAAGTDQFREVLKIMKADIVVPAIEEAIA